MCVCVCDDALVYSVCVCVSVLVCCIYSTDVHVVMDEIWDVCALQRVEERERERRRERERKRSWWFVYV